MAKIVGITGQEITAAAKKVPAIKGIRPYGSKILVEVLNPDEVLNTNLFVDKDAKVSGAPQAYILELGNQVPPDSGLEVGQRIYWTGKGTSIEDPRSTDRVRALLELHNILAIIEE